MHRLRVCAPQRKHCESESLVGERLVGERLGAGVEVVLYAVVDVVGGAGLHLRVGMGLGHALTVELQPGEAAFDVGEVAVGGVGVQGDELVEVLERGVKGGGGIVAEGGGVVECGPGGGVQARGGDGDWRGGTGDRVPLVVTVADDVVDEEPDDDGKEDEVAGAEAHGVGRAVPAWVRCLVGSVDEVLGEGFQGGGGGAEGGEGGEGVGDEGGGVFLGLLDAVDGGPGGFDGGGVLAGGLTEFGGGLGHVEDVVDDLEGEAGVFAEGAEAGDEVGVVEVGGNPGSRTGTRGTRFGGEMGEAEEAAGDDAGGDEGSGFGAVDALDELGGRMDAFGLDVDDLAADHAGGDCGGSADAGADGEGEVAEDGDDGGGWGGEVGEDLEGEILEGVAGEDGDGFTVGDVAGGLAATEVVVVEGGEVVVDEGVGVGHLDGGTELGCAGRELAGGCDHARGFHAEDGAEALAAGEDAVAHGAVNGVRLGGGGGEEALERGVGEGDAGGEEGLDFCVHGQCDST